MGVGRGVESAELKNSILKLPPTSLCSALFSFFLLQISHRILIFNMVIIVVAYLLSPTIRPD